MPVLFSGIQIHNLVNSGASCRLALGGSPGVFNCFKKLIPRIKPGHSFLSHRVISCQCRASKSIEVRFQAVPVYLKNID